MAWETSIQLQPHFFQEAEKTLVEHESLSAQIYRYSSGVCALRLKNNAGQMTLLPFQGQQIWDLVLDGRTLTMKSMFDQPRATREYLETYGGFLIHCGMTAMGVPAEGDHHPLHGELPNAPYQTAQLLIGEDEEGAYLGLTGTYQHTVAFSCNYVAQPQVKLYADSTRIPISMTITNLKKSPMEYMYLAHVNFRPLNQSELIYSAPCTPDQVRVRSSIPSHISPPAGYREFLAELEADPQKHNYLDPALMFDPEVVFYIAYQSDADGWAYTLQRRPDGTADYIRHRPVELGHGVRWICRTADQDALGMVLPATAEPEGYTAEKAKGNIESLPAGGVFRCHMEVGTLDGPAAERMVQQIGQILK